MATIDTPTPADTRALYDLTAANWARRAPASLSDFTARPPVLDLCEPVAGRAVLDLGCGEGYCSRILAERGAQVLGIDISERMIDLARQAEQARPLGITYATGDATRVACADAQFDLVLAMFLFNYLDVEGTRTTMTQIHRMLKPGGHFVFAVPHPAYAFMREPVRPFYFDVAGAGYFSARDVRHPGKIWRRDGVALDVQMVHKTFEDYFEALRGAGFTRLPVVRELKADRGMLELDPEFFSPLMDFPLHVALKVQRI